MAGITRNLITLLSIFMGYIWVSYIIGAAIPLFHTFEYGIMVTVGGCVMLIFGLLAIDQSLLD